MSETEVNEEKRKEVQAALAKSSGGEIVDVTASLFSPFVDFVKDYMAFFGIKDSLEDYLRSMIYKEVRFLHNELTAFADEKKHLIDTTDWYWKHGYVSTAAFEGPEEEGE